MRLLRTDVENGYKMDVFDDLATTPPYAILSHRWGPNEVLYRDLISEGPKDGARFQKLIGCCKRAREDGYNYVWIDTCCIDQKSSAELSQSINSMFLWYVMAAVCYVHLQDVPSAVDPHSADSAFRKSVWFTRGWTLQELIAPSNVVFLTETWAVIGDKGMFAATIEEITGISYTVLCGLTDLEDINVAEKMSWASNRKTTKVEDRAYSLLGIFGVNMPAIYGEGQRAFQRLQYEIISQSNDHSIFAWEMEPSSISNPLKACGLLAPSPDVFARSANIITTPLIQFAIQWGNTESVPDIQRTNVGFRLEVPVFEVTSPHNVLERNSVIMVIACKRVDRSASSSNYCTVGVVLQQDSEGYYNRLKDIELLDVGRLRSLGTRYGVKKIDIRGESKRAELKGSSSRISPYTPKPKAYQVVLKAHTLDTLRNDHQWILAETPISVSEASAIPLKNSMLRVYGHTWEWVENPRTKEKDLVVTVQSRPTSEDKQTPPTSEDGSDQKMIHSLKYHWNFSDTGAFLDIFFDPRNPGACLGCKLDSQRFGRFRYLTAPTVKVNHHWSGNGHNGKSVDIFLTRTNLTVEEVHYELDIIIRDVLHPDALTSTSASTSTMPRSQKTRRWGLKQFFKTRTVECQWVPTCFGVVPDGAYYDFNESHTDVFHIARAYHEGELKLGFLSLRSTSAFMSSFDDLDSHRSYTYEILVGTPSLLEWILVRGPFTLEALRGAIPVDGGISYGQAVYVVRASWMFPQALGNNDQYYEHEVISGVVYSGLCYGMVRADSHPRVMHINHEIVDKVLPRTYEVLVYKKT